MSIGKRLLWTVLLLTIVAAMWPLPQDNPAEEASGQPHASRNRNATRDALPPSLQLGALGATRRSAKSEVVDLFPRQGYTPPVANAAPDKPVAPALPFTYGGSYTEGSTVLVFLKEGDKIHTARLGDKVNAAYRVDKIEPAAITLTYLPLGLQQTLQTGSTIRQ